MSDKMESQKDKTGVEILPHDYDGIQELNNPLPGWWLMTFYMTIIFGIGYFGYYEVFDGPSSDQYLSEALDKLNAKKIVAKTENANKPILSFEELKTDQKMMAAGQAHYSSKCSPCHGQKGEGVIGPNLTDAFWISSKGDIPGILKAIREGFLDKGMPPWNELVPAEEQPYLAAYVMTLHGTNPPNGKEPQGEEIK